jgi:hypothetical protein
MGLETFNTVPNVTWPIADDCERLVPQALERFLERQYAGGMAGFLVERSSAFDPFGDCAPLRVMERELLGPARHVALAPLGQIRHKAAVRLRRNLTGESVTHPGIEQNLAATALEVALPLRRLGVLERSHRRIRQKRFGKLLVDLERLIAALGLLLGLLDVVRAFELMVARGVSKKVLG